MFQPVCIGIDLSGPSNAQDTSLCLLSDSAITLYNDCNDQKIIEILQQLPNDQAVLIAADAPLTYQDGGGFRDIDRALRQHLNQQGFKKIGVMAPTMTRMAYLTLRGLRLKEVCREFVQVQLFETHPGAALVCSGMDYELVQKIKTEPQAVHSIYEQLARRLPDAMRLPNIRSDHDLMAFSAMLSAYNLSRNLGNWRISSEILGQPDFIL